MNITSETINGMEKSSRSFLRALIYSRALLALLVCMFSSSIGSALLDYGDAPDTATGTSTGNYEILAANGDPSSNASFFEWIDKGNIDSFDENKGDHVKLENRDTTVDLYLDISQDLETYAIYPKLTIVTTGYLTTNLSGGFDEASFVELVNGHLKDNIVSISTLALVSSCPAGYVLGTPSPNPGSADTVTGSVSSGSTANVQGAPSAAGTTATTSNSALLDSGDQITADLGELVAVGATLEISLAQEDKNGIVGIEVSSDDLSYSSLGSWGKNGTIADATAALNVLERLSLTVPAGGVRYVRITSENKTVWVDGFSYTEICTAIVSTVDYGDAPDTAAGTGTGNYETLLANGGPSHTIISGLEIGTAPDGDSDGFADGTDAGGDATDDDSVSTADEGSIIFGALYIADTSYSLSNIAVTNTTGSDATLFGWIDLDQNGSFDEDELASATVTNGATTANLTWASLPGITVGTTYARFRLTTTGDLTAGSDGGADEASLGTAASGEVEDYQLTILVNTTVPDVSVVCAVADGEPRISVQPDTWWDINTNPMPGNVEENNDPNIVTATGVPVSVGSGISLTALFTSWTFNNVDATTIEEARALNEFIEVSFQTGNLPAYVYEWSTFNSWGFGPTGIDIAKSSDFSDAVNVYDGTPSGPGSTWVDTPLKGLMYLEPNTTYYMRVYVYGSTSVNMDAIGINVGSCGDFGDAPDTASGTGIDNYETLSANGGPSHSIISDLKIGTGPGGDTDGFADGTDANGDATDDDSEGTADEGSITFGALTTAATSYSINSIAVTNTTGSNATLFAWIDFDQNGSFDEDELASATVANGATTANLTWASLPGIVTGTTYARFRLATTGDLTAGSDGGADEASLGTAASGEVEDYQVTVTFVSRSLSGVIFEDVNYGGGAGRDQATSSGVGRNGVTVELYDNAGSLVATTTTANSGSDGQYSFTGLADGSYFVRVVNGDVTSSRTGSDGSEVSVQTFRTDGTTANTSEVGGRVPSASDAVANTGAETLNTTTFVLSTSGQTQSVQSVTVSGADVGGVDFGYNFNTIVNTNDAGQGSLRQFILNANLLGNAGLNQDLDAAIDGEYATGDEVSIFMIPPMGDPFGRTADSGYQSDAAFSGGLGSAFIIQPSGIMPTISTSDIAIDGRTQTNYSGDSNGAVSEVSTGPEVVIDGQGTTVVNLVITNSPFYVRHIGWIRSNDVGLSNGKINAIGTSNPSFIESVTTAESINWGVFLEGSSNVTIRNSIIRDNGLANNQVDGIVMSIPLLSNNNLVENNIIKGNGAYGIDVVTLNSIGNIIRNNIIKGNGFFTGLQNAGIGLRGGNNTLVEGNTISGNSGGGIIMRPEPTNNTIRQNSIFANGTLGIDLAANPTNIGDGITVNDANDSDIGGNNLLNFPVLNTLTLSGGNLIITGCAMPGSIIELFEADVSPTSTSGATAGDNQFGLSTDYGEGEVYLGTVTEGSGADTDGAVCALPVDADGNDQTGMNAFSFTIAAPAGVVAGDLLTSTATDASGNTSEFSPIPSAAKDASEDYGDAPDTASGTGTGNYETLLANGGPSHTIISGLEMGTAPDSDTDGFADGTDANSDATDDDAEGTADEGSITLGALTTTDTSYTLSGIAVTNTTGSDAKLFAWIDFDQNGSFDEDEIASTTVANGATTANLSWASLPGIVSGTTYARFRLAIAGDLTTGSDGGADEGSLGGAASGEVEDYQVAVTAAAVPFPCTGEVYQVKYESGTATTTLFQNTFSGASLPYTGTFTAINSVAGNRNGGWGIYAEGDRLAYGVEGNTPKHLWTLDAAGTFTDLGVVAGLPLGPRYFSGDVLPDGRLVIKTNIQDSVVYFIDITSAPYTAVALNLSQAFDIAADMAYNPADGQIYAVDYTSNRLVFFDPTTGVTTFFGPSTYTDVYGAFWFDQNGNMIAFNNDTGDFINIDAGVNGSGTGNFILIANTAPNGSNDGLSCRGASPYPNGSISGNVFADLNGNLTYESGTDTDLPDITVELYDENGTTGNTSDDVLIRSSVVSAVDGSYSFTGLPLGITYRIEIDETDTDIPAGLGLATPDPIEGVTVVDGVDTGDQDFGFSSPDYGDAPDTASGTGTGNYETLLANGGPSHTIVSGLQIGTAPDSDIDGFADGTDTNSDATDDDTEGTADEGSIAFGALSSGDTSYSLSSIAVTNTTGSDATLFGWIDFDQNGSFDEDEVATATVANGTTTANLSWASLPGIVSGTTYARFRLASAGDLTAGSDGGADEGSLGGAASGEVEDYQATVTTPPIVVATPLPCASGIGGTYADWTLGGTSGTGQFASAPNIPVMPDFTFQVTGDVSSVGVDAFETFTGTNTLEPIYGQADSEENLNIASIGNGGSSGDPIVFNTVLTIDFNSPTPASGWGFSTHDLDTDQLVISAKDASGTDVPVATIASWFIEVFDADPTSNGINLPFWDPSVAALIGSDSDFPTYQTVTHTGIGSGTEAGGAWFQPNISLSQLSIRFESLTAGSSSVSYHIYLASCLEALSDYGDAPDTASGTGTGNYETLVANGGPSHTIISGLEMGTAPDGDTDGFADGTDAGGDATDDDSEGTADEGSITLGALTTTDTSYTLSGIAVTNTTGSDAKLFAWIDFDQNGSFDEDEIASTTVANGVTTANLSWASFPGIVSGTTYARFRLAIAGDLTTGSDGGADEGSLGGAASGEVEDYQVAVTAAAVPFPCTGEVYQVKYESGTATTTLFQNTFSGASLPYTGTFTAINSVAGNRNGGWGIYAEGDRLAYGVEGNTPKHLWTLDAAGTFTDLGVVAGLPLGPRYFSGDVLPDGRLVIKTNNQDSVVYFIDITSAPYTAVALNLSQAFDIADMAYNPADGQIYAVDHTSDRLVLFDPTTGVTTFFGPSTYTDVYGAFWFDQNGNMFAFNNDTGDFINIDVGVNASGTGNSYLIAAGSSNSANDGLSCRGAPPYSNGSISGNVFADLNGNLTYESGTDTDLPDITVELYDENGTTGNTSDDVLIRSSVVSAVDGSYSFTGLPLGITYRIEIDETDTDIPAGLGLATPDPIEGVTVADGVDTSNQDFGFNSVLDYGDAPDTASGTGAGNYETLSANGGPSHTIISGLEIGTAPDGDTDGFADGTDANNDGTDDDTEGTADEGSISFTSLCTSETSYSLTGIAVTNTTGSDAILFAWIDFDQNGSFDEDEVASVTIANTATTANLTWASLPGIVSGTTYARFRLASAGDLTVGSDGGADEASLGTAVSGEVEDYQVTIVQSCRVAITNPHIMYYRKSN